jgi:hypothetical protein
VFVVLKEAVKSNNGGVTDTARSRACASTVSLGWTMIYVSSVRELTYVILKVRTMNLLEGVQRANFKYVRRSETLRHRTRGLLSMVIIIQLRRSETEARRTEPPRDLT